MIVLSFSERQIPQILQLDADIGLTFYIVIATSSEPLFQCLYVTCFAMSFG